MKIGGLSFSPIWGAAGVQNIDGNGYWYHPFLKTFGLKFDGCTFVSKTATAFRKKGHMPLLSDGITPKEWFPDCVYKDVSNAVALNAIALSNFGIPYYLHHSIWEGRRDPYWISFMAVKENREERLEECRTVAAEFIRHKSRLGKFGIQVNISCFNAIKNLAGLFGCVYEELNILGQIGVPLQVKINALMPIEHAIEIGNHPNCSSLCTTNAIPYASTCFPERWWKGTFGNKSPLSKYGDGALSGDPLRKLVLDQIFNLRKRGFKKPINGGGGILKPDHVVEMRDSGANSVFIGSIAFLRPHRVAKTIERAHQITF